MGLRGPPMGNWWGEPHGPNSWEPLANIGPKSFQIGKSPTLRAEVKYVQNNSVHVILMNLQESQSNPILRATNSIQLQLFHDVYTEIVSFSDIFWHCLKKPKHWHEAPPQWLRTIGWMRHPRKCPKGKYLKTFISYGRISHTNSYVCQDTKRIADNHSKKHPQSITNTNKYKPHTTTHDATAFYESIERN